jgi:hypothetical protein
MQGFEGLRQSRETAPGFVFPNDFKEQIDPFKNMLSQEKRLLGEIPGRHRIPASLGAALKRTVAEAKRWIKRLEKKPLSRKKG